MVQKTAIIDLEKTFLLGDVLVEPMLNRISQGPCSVHVERQVMLLLVHLAKHSNEPVTREALYRAVWTQSEPNDEALTQAISKLRKALTDVGAEKGIVETIRKVGYRVTADVQSVQSPRKVASQGPLSRAAAPPGHSTSQEQEGGRLGVSNCHRSLCSIEQSLNPVPPPSIRSGRKSSSNHIGRRSSRGWVGVDHG